MHVSLAAAALGIAVPIDKLTLARALTDLGRTTRSLAAAAAAPAAPAADEALPPTVHLFLRGIRPPLACLRAALAALPRSGVTLEQLRELARERGHAAVDRELHISIAAEALAIAAPAEKLKFALALAALGRGA